MKTIKANCYIDNAKIAIYQVGEVYPDSPKEQHHLYFISALAGSFPADEIEKLPLSETKEEAEERATAFLLNQLLKHRANAEPEATKTDRAESATGQAKQRPKQDQENPD